MDQVQVQNLAPVSYHECEKYGIYRNASKYKQYELAHTTIHEASVPSPQDSIVQMRSKCIYSAP